MKRAALYARVSTINQVDGTSPGDQLSRAREYAESKGYKIVGSETDAISGAFIFARVALMKYLEMMEAGLLDVIVVDIPDRLGRGDAIAQCEMLAKLNGGRVEYATPGRDDTTVEGMALKATETLVSGIERYNIRRRTMGGRNSWAEKGRVIASGYRPYGYKYVKSYDPTSGRKIDCQMQPIPEEAEIVVSIFEWCALDGLTTTAIAKRLTGLSILTLADIEGVRKKKRGAKGEWHRDTVHGMLTNTTYKGEWRYRKNKITREDTPDGVKTHVERRNIEDSIAVPVPAIVSSELWDAAQAQLKKNAKKGFKPTKYKYLLRSRLRCGKCGGAMFGNTRVSKSKKGTSINWHYRCRRKYQFGIKSPSACDSKNINGPMVESGVWNQVVGLLLDESRLFQEIEVQRDEQGQVKRIIKQTIESKTNQNKEYSKKLDRLLDLYLEGGLNKAIYLKKRREYEEAISERLEDIRRLNHRLEESKPVSTEMESELLKLRNALIPRLEDASFEQRSQLINTLQIECVYHDDTGEVLMTGVFGAQKIEPLSTVCGLELHRRKDLEISHVFVHSVSLW